ncbi:MAG: ATP-binding cassette domain-containing protein, partial [Rhodothermales bacterium]
MDDLHVDYGTQQGLSGVTFTAPEGSFVAVLGPNGSGKTSLIKALAGIVSPSRGSIRVLRRDPRKAGSGLVGYVPQVKTLERRFPATSVELVVSGMRGRWPFRVSASERSAALDALGHAGGVHLAERQLSTLSGGELQRIYLARSLIRHPHLVLLDEPATGIDAAGALDLYDVLETYQ